jgi:transposase InsO family protein
MGRTSRSLRPCALGRFNSVGHRITGRRTGYCSSQGSGWEFVHVAVDDHSRVARADIFPDQKKESAVAFLIATIAYFKSLGVTVERVMTDNGSCHLSEAFARACKQFGVKHIRIKPYCAGFGAVTGRSPLLSPQAFFSS